MNILNRLVIRMIAVAVAMCVMAACQSPQNSGRVSADAIAVDRIIKSGKPESILKSANLSNEDRSAVEDARAYYDFFSEKWISVLRNARREDIDIDALRSDYDELVYQYGVVEGIALAHINDYSDGQIATLVLYQRRAIAIDSSVKELIERGERNQAIESAIDYGLLIVKMVAP